MIVIKSIVLCSILLIIYAHISLIPIHTYDLPDYDYDSDNGSDNDYDSDE